MKKIFLYSMMVFSVLFVAPVSLFGSSIALQDIYSDIDNSNEYLQEFQFLYERGVIFQDFQDTLLLDSPVSREEFLGILMEASCDTCMQPGADISFLQNNFQEKILGDTIDGSPYGMCVLEAEKSGFLSKFSFFSDCDSLSVSGESEFFCPKNTLSKKEALPLLLQYAGIYTPEENNQILSAIQSGESITNIGNDIPTIYPTGEINQDFGYFLKASEFVFREVSPQGLVSIQRLLEEDTQGNYNLDDTLTRKELLSWAYIIMKISNCQEDVHSDFPVQIISVDDQNRENLEIQAESENVCSAGIDEQTGYTWSLYNREAKSQLFFQSKSVQVSDIPSPGLWHISLYVQDLCGGKSYAKSQVYLGEGNSQTEEKISLSLQVEKLQMLSSESFDFSVNISPGERAYRYHWDLGDGRTRIGKNISTSFSQSGNYRIKLIVGDDIGNLASAEGVIHIQSQDACDLDSDNDGIMDCDDACPSIAGLVLNRGCPIFEQACDADCRCPDGFTCQGDSDLSCGEKVCRPQAIETNCYYSPETGVFVGKVACNSCPCQNELAFNSPIKTCDIIFPAIISPDGTQIYSRGASVIVP